MVALSSPGVVAPGAASKSTTLLRQQWQTRRQRARCKGEEEIPSGGDSASTLVSGAEDVEGKDEGLHATRSQQVVSEKTDGKHRPSADVTSPAPALAEAGKACSEDGAGFDVPKLIAFYSGGVSPSRVCSEGDSVQTPSATLTKSKSARQRERQKKKKAAQEASEPATPSDLVASVAADIDVEAASVEDTGNAVSTETAGEDTAKIPPGGDSARTLVSGADDVKGIDEMHATRSQQGETKEETEVKEDQKVVGSLAYTMNGGAIESESTGIRSAGGGDEAGAGVDVDDGGPPGVAGVDVGDVAIILLAQSGQSKSKSAQRRERQTNKKAAQKVTEPGMPSDLAASVAEGTLEETEVKGDQGAVGSLADTAKETAQAAPQAPAKAESATPSWERGVPFTLTLDIDFATIGDHEDFKQGILADVAAAAKVDVKYVQIQGLHAGSVIVNLLIAPEVGEPHKVLQDLREQVNCPGSCLMTGKLTNKTKGLVAQAQLPAASAGAPAKPQDPQISSLAPMPLPSSPPMSPRARMVALSSPGVVAPGAASKSTTLSREQWQTRRQRARGKGEEEIPAGGDSANTLVSGAEDVEGKDEGLHATRSQQVDSEKAAGEYETSANVKLSALLVSVSSVPTHPASKDLLVVDLAVAKRARGEGKEMDKVEDGPQGGTKEETEVKEDRRADLSLVNSMKGGAMKSESTGAGVLEQGARTPPDSPPGALSHREQGVLSSQANTELNDLFGGSGTDDEDSAGIDVGDVAMMLWAKSKSSQKRERQRERTKADQQANKTTAPSDLALVAAVIDVQAASVKEDQKAVLSRADTMKAGATKCESTGAGVVGQGAQHKVLSAALAELDDLFGSKGSSDTVLEIAEGSRSQVVAGNVNYSKKVVSSLQSSSVHGWGAQYLRPAARPGPTISAPASAVPTNPTSKDLLVVDLAAAKRNQGGKGEQMEKKEDCVQGGTKEETEVKEDLWAVGSLADNIKGYAMKSESTGAGVVVQGAHAALSTAHAELDDLFGGAGGSLGGVAGQRPKGALLAAHAELDDLFGSAGGGPSQ
jgi:hypothetical protein